MAKNILPINAALWTSDGTISFSGDGTNGAFVTPSGFLKVKTLTLESIVKMAQVNNVDFIKMDIESAELNILPESGAFLDKFKAKWVIEVHDKINGVKILKSIFQSHGYAVEVLSELPTPILFCEPV